MIEETVTPSPSPSPTPTPTPTPKPTLSPEQKNKIKTYILENRDTDPKLKQFANLTVEELEELIELFDYETPLYGELLKTGDETPVYPFIFIGIGLLILLYVAFSKRII